MLFFFFFQAEDGIRDADVTGVQTCALPISGDAKGHGSSCQERAIGGDLFQQPSADELIHGLAKRFACNVCRQVNSGVIAATTAAPPRPCSRRGRIPEGVARPERSHYRSVRGRMPVLSG